MKAKYFRLIKAFFFIFSLFFLATLNVSAQTAIASWTYDSVQGTNSNPTPNIGTGTSSVVNLLTTPTTATGLSSSTGCGAANSGLGWQHPTFNPGSSNEVNGVQFNSGTIGYTNIIFSWDQRFSKTAPNTVRLQYTTNGSTWTNFTMTGANTTICAGAINVNGCFETNAGDAYRRVRVDLTSIVAANNNANFGIRLLASQYQSTGQYRQSSTPAVVATNTGTWRFDNVNFLGTPLTTGGVISGSTTICPASSANINVTITGGVSPYTIIYTDGTSNFTVNNYTSGSNIAVTPGSTTTYTLVSVTDSTSAPISPTSGSAVVTVNAGSSPTFTASAGANSCAGASIVYTTQAGMDNYAWTFLKGASPAVPVTDYNIIAGSTATETVTIQWVLASGTATFSATATYSTCLGASVTSTTTVSVPVITLTSQPGATACLNSDVTYVTQAGQSSYVWAFPGSSIGSDYSITSGSTTDTLVIKWLNTTSNRTVSVNYTDSNGCVAPSATVSTATSIYPLPSNPTITATSTPLPAAGSNYCAGIDITYTTTAGFANYVWTIPGTLSSDYLITGGATNTNSVKIQWLTSGSKTITVNYSNGAPSPNCPAAVAGSYVTNVNLPPVITVQPSTAGQTTCQLIPFSPLSLTATTASGSLSYQWNSVTSPTVPSYSGTPSLPSGGIPAGGTNPFTPSSASAGTRYYYVVVTSSGTGCTGVAGTKSTFWTSAYTVNATATASAGGPNNVCQSASPSAITLTGATIGGSATTGAWAITSGGGTLSTSAQTATPAAVTYTPAANYSGTVTLTLTSNFGTGCAAATATRTINVNAITTANAGGPDALCQSASPTAITLSGASVGGSATTGAWSIFSGGGTLSSTAQTATPAAVTYTPAANYSGTVTLTFTSNFGTGCAAATASRTINVNAIATASAGGPNTVCQSASPTAITLTGATVGGSATTGAWAITSGGGTLSTAAQTATPAAVTYTPAANYSGTVTLTLTSDFGTGCTAATAIRTITVTPNATAIAGGPNSVCQSASPTAITLTAASVSGGATTGAWSISSGGGTLSTVAQTATPAAVTYTPAANYSGTVALTLTSNVGTGCSTPATVTRTINVNAIATAVSGGPDSVCQSASPIAITLTGASVGGSASTGAWAITSGGGTLSTSAQTATPAAVTYTPAANYSGTVTLTLTSNFGTGCTAASAIRTINVNAIATAISGGPDSVCESASPTAITLTGASVGGSATTGAWSISSGGGTLSSAAQTATPASVTYTPAANYSGTVTLTLTSNFGTGCTAATALRTITATPTSVGGSISGSTTVCSGTNSTTLTLSGYTGSITKWQSSPVSNFASGVVDIANTTTTLTVANLTATTYYRVEITSGVCSSANSAIATILVNPVSVAGTITGGTNICSFTNSTTLTLSGQTGSIVKWQSSTVSDFSSSITDIVNTTTTLVATNLTATTYYRVVVQSSPCAIAYSSFAQIAFITTTWDGTSWDNGVPDTTTKAIFGALYNSAGSGLGDLQACSLEVLSGAIVTVKSGDSFTIQNEIKVAGAPLPAALIMENASNLIQVNNVVNTDYVYYRRTTTPVRKYDYTYWSSPVSNQLLSTFSPNSAYYYLWNNIAPTTYNWSFVAPSTTMAIARGYIIRTPDIAPYNTSTANTWSGEFFGVPNNGTITTPIVLSGVNDLNLIGNPYPSAIDADSFLTFNKPSNGGVLGGTLFFWTHNTPITAYNYSGNDYASYNLTGGIGTRAALSSPCSGCNNAIPNGKIGAGQSFFILAAGTGNATFNNAMRFGANNQFYKTNWVSNSIEKNRLWIDISNVDGLYKQLLVGYIEGATNDYDMEFDGISVDAGNAIMVYSLLGDKKLGIQGRALSFDLNDEIPIGYKSTVAGNFEINLSDYDGFFANQEVYLEDTLLNLIHNLKSGSYSFPTEIGTFDTRFKLIFRNSTLSIPAVSASSFIVYNSNNQITVNSGTVEMKEIVVYDIEGRIITKYNIQNLSEFSFGIPTKNQVLLLKIITSENKIYYKKVLS